MILFLSVMLILFVLKEPEPPRQECSFSLQIQLLIQILKTPHELFPIKLCPHFPQFIGQRLKSLPDLDWNWSISSYLLLTNLPFEVTQIGEHFFKYLLFLVNLWCFYDWLHSVNLFSLNVWLLSLNLLWFSCQINFLYIVGFSLKIINFILIRKFDRLMHCLAHRAVVSILSIKLCTLSLLHV